MPHHNRLHDWEETIRAAIARESPRPWCLRCFEEVSSTMDAAREVAAQAPDRRPGLVLAAKQSKGRGCGDHRWEQVQTALYATFIFFPEKVATPLSAFSLVTGTVVQNILKQLGCATTLKWPNDVLAANGKKVSGILTESVMGERTVVYTGIGINLAGDVSHVHYETGVTTVLEECGKSVTPLDIAGLLASPLSEAFEAFCREGFSPFAHQWNAVAYQPTGSVKIVSPHGELTGKMRGADSEGRLLIESQGRTHHVSSGEVRLRV